VNKRLSALGIL